METRLPEEQASPCRSVSGTSALPVLVRGCVSCLVSLTADGQLHLYSFGWLLVKEQTTVVVPSAVRDSTLFIFSLIPNNATEQSLHFAEKEQQQKINVYVY